MLFMSYLEIFIYCKFTKVVSYFLLKTLQFYQVHLGLSSILSLCVCVCIYIHIYMYAYMCMCGYIYIYIYKIWSKVRVHIAAYRCSIFSAPLVEKKLSFSHWHARTLLLESNWPYIWPIFGICILFHWS